MSQWINGGQLSTALISRQAAIDAVGSMLRRKFGIGGDLAEITLAGLPSAQPEIIRCKDCKHWDGVDTCDVIDAPVWDNDFCSMAERRSNE